MDNNTINKRRTFIINVAYFAIVVALAFCVIKYAIPLLSPFVIGFIIAAVLQKPIKQICKYTPLNRKFCALLVTLIFYCIVITLIYMTGAKGLELLKNFIIMIPSLYSNQIEPAMMDFFNQLEQFADINNEVQNLLMEVEDQFIDKLSQIVTTISVSAVEFISSFAASIPGLFVKLVLLIISSVFIAMDYNKLMEFCLNQMSQRARGIFIEVKNYVVGTLFVVIASYALIMTITFVELSIGLKLIGIEHAVLIAGGIAIFDILPVLGTGGIMLPWAVFSLVRGQTSLAVGLILVYVFVTVVRNILEPKIVGSQLGLHPIVTLSSMFAGVQLLGVVGLFGFPIFLSLMCYLDKAGVIKIFKKAELETS